MTVFCLRLSPEDRVALARLAAQHGLKPSTMLRFLLRQAAQNAPTG